ncbi:hypothetical protein MKQ68_08130 [Chitinophaga horti]|uniref:Uncharacterized protein n=1 Tax=Chitinophaga horti TaxID=2920382 RepID=A0ABY6J5V6_9BACT|nr:hypothetical protein [Chitinophaga horti]UYQ95061.1 hypothetical protein MKQ68_08130 [Chitinophaga horti]
MARSANPLLMGVSGSIADQLTIRNIGGKTFLSKKVGKRQKPATKKQLKNENKFAKANEIISERYADLVLREEARLRLKVPSGRPVFRAMLKEYLEELKKEHQ